MARVREVDVVVVGARVAGATLATLLGSAGWTTLVVDRARFPSPTLSTHFFRGAGCVSVLDRLGVLAEVLATGPPRLTREYNADAVTGTFTIDPPQDPGEIGYCLSVRRETLNAILVRRARQEPTVDVLEGTTLSRLVEADGRIVGVEVDDGTRPCEVAARFVVGADGRGSQVAKLVDAAIVEQHAASRAMYYRYTSGLTGPEGAPDGPEFSTGDDELAYVFPCDGPMACVALSVNLRDYAAMRPSAAQVFEQRLAAHPFLADRVAGATWTGRLLGCGPRPGIVRMPVGPGWALVGDASLYQDPWTGLGMDNASVHATFLAEALDDVLAGRAADEQAMSSYHRRRDEHALAGFRETCAVGGNLNVLQD